DDRAAVGLRRDALTALLDARDEQLPLLLQRLVANPALRSESIRGLAAFDDPRTPAILLRLYPSLDTAGKQVVIGTLTARASYAQALMEAVGRKELEARDVS